MAAQKLTKKDLKKKDSFITSTENLLEYVQRNATAVGIVLLAIVVLAVGGSYVRKGQQASRIEASYMLYQGQMLLSEGQFELAMAPLQDCIEKHGGSEFGKYARLSLVQAMLANGEFVAYGALTLAMMQGGTVPATVWLLLVMGVLVTALDGSAALRAGQVRRAAAVAGWNLVYPLALLAVLGVADSDLILGAADAIAATIDDHLADYEIYTRTVQQATWLQKAGDDAAALSLLENLRDRTAAGEIDNFGRDLDTRIEIARALR